MNVKAQEKAIGAFVDLIALTFGEEKAIHPATAISVSGWLSGSFLLRSLNINIATMEPGTVVLSEEVNTEGATLLNLAMAFLEQTEVPINHDKLKEAATDSPKVTFIEALNSIQEPVVNIMLSCGFSFAEMARCTAIATAFIVKQCANDLEVETGFTTGAYAIVEGAKTVPPTLSKELQETLSNTPSNSKKKKWYQFW